MLFHVSAIFFHGAMFHLFLSYFLAMFCNLPSMLFFYPSSTNGTLNGCSMRFYIVFCSLLESFTMLFVFPKFKEFELFWCDVFLLSRSVNTIVTFTCQWQVQLE